MDPDSKKQKLNVLTLILPCSRAYVNKLYNVLYTHFFPEACTYLHSHTPSMI